MSRLKKGATAGGVAIVTVTLIANLAADEGRKYVPYKDIAGILTVCAGITGPAVIPGKRYTPHECDDLETTAIRKHGEGLLACVTQPLTQNQYEALTRLTYNIGIAGTCRSTLIKHVNAGTPSAQWCNELVAFSYAHVNGVKKFIPGLYKRHDRERKQCLEDE